MNNNPKNKEVQQQVGNHEEHQINADALTENHDTGCTCSNRTTGGWAYCPQHGRVW